MTYMDHTPLIGQSVLSFLLLVSLNTSEPWNRSVVLVWVVSYEVEGSGVESHKRISMSLVERSVSCCSLQI